jgi:hypothetical protein
LNHISFSQKIFGFVFCLFSSNFFKFRNGRWRSEWHLPIFDGKVTTYKCSGELRLQIHYYEDGNVQLISEKNLNVDVKMSVRYININVGFN